VIAASLAFPAIGRAQSFSSEHALLNRTSTAPEGTPGLGALLYAGADPAFASTVTGEQALRGTTAPAAWNVRFDWGVAPIPRRRPVIDGEAALLGARD
jgi:hypothetical protein